MARLRSRSRSRHGSRGVQARLAAVRNAFPSLRSTRSRSSGSDGFRNSHRTGLRLSQDLLNLALIVVGVRFALTGAFITVVSSHALLVLGFNLLVTAPAMYRLLRRLGWVDGPAIGPDLVLAGTLGLFAAISGTLRSRRSSNARHASKPSLRHRLAARLGGHSLPGLRSVRAALPSRGGSSSDRL